MKNIIFKSILISSLVLSVSCLKEDDGIIFISPLEGTTLAPEVGGATQPNQVWVDLSTQQEYFNKRTDWDLGFYSGTEFRVVLNNSILMAAAPIESNDIDAVSQADFSDLVSILAPPAGWPEQYIDDVAGNYLDDGTVIDEISENDAENKVYLLKLGYYTYPDDSGIPPYSTYTIGDPRGFKKIRILKNDENSYKIQYADLNDSGHSEFIVEKDPDYNFTFFSFETENLAQIQPEKENWDICFTVWNNVIEGYGTYTYADFVISNTLSGVGSYEVITDPSTAEDDYNNFSMDDVDESLFVYNDQRAIGSNWRSTVSGTTSTPVVKSDRFYVLKDAEGFLFKIRFISMLDENNMRGYPQFEYEPL